MVWLGRCDSDGGSRGNGAGSMVEKALRGRNVFGVDQLSVSVFVSVVATRFEANNEMMLCWFLNRGVVIYFMRIGIDITHTGRFDRLVNKHGERFVRRFLSDDEVATWRSSSSPSRFLASRWSAKEALTKALGTKQVFSKVQVDSDGLGPPTFRALSDEWRKTLPSGVSLSITHDLDIAAAVVVIPLTESRT